MTTTIIGFALIIISFIATIIIFSDKTKTIKSDLQRFKESKDFADHYIQMHDNLISIIFTNIHEVEAKVNEIEAQLKPKKSLTYKEIEVLKEVNNLINNTPYEINKEKKQVWNKLFKGLI